MKHLKKNNALLTATLLLFFLMVAGCSQTGAGVNKQLELAVKYLSEGKFEEAVLAYNEVLKIDPKNLPAYKGLGKAYTLQGYYEEAKRVYEQGLNVVEDKAQLKLALAGLYVDENRPDRAIEVYKELIKADPGYLPAYEGLARLLLHQGKTEEAINLLLECASINRDNERSYSLLAEAYVRVGDKEKALEALRKSLEISLNQQAAYELIDKLFNGDWPAVIAFGEQTLAENEKVGRMLKIYGYYNSGQYEKAIEEFANLGQGPQFSKTVVYAALSHLKNNDPKAAEQLIERINLASEKNPCLYADVARFHLENGNLEKALKIALDGLELDDTCLENYRVLYELATKRNDPKIKYYPYLVLTRSTEPVSFLKEKLREEGIPVNFPSGAVGQQRTKVPDDSTSATPGAATGAAPGSAGSGVPGAAGDVLLTSTVIVLDVSDSMNENWRDGVKIESAKTAASQMLGLIARESEKFGPKHEVSVITFATSASLELAATREIEQAREIIENLSASGNTNIGDALALANAQLEETEAKKKMIILLSDGKTNTGLSRDEIVEGPVKLAQEAGYLIFTIGFGDPGDLDEDLLQRIAQSTGGSYSYAEGNFDLQNVYLKVRHEATGKILAAFKGEISQGETKEVGKIQVAQGLGQLHSTLNWGGSALDLTLKDPRGKIVDEKYPGARIFNEKPFYIIVENPRPGEWTAIAYGREVPEKRLAYDFIASGREREKKALPYLGLIIFMGGMSVVVGIAVFIFRKVFMGCCPGCGLKLESDYRHCPYCGHKVKK
ncbi:tetratricopeptide (TPR) repeat protein/uncharacterized protein YegL [Desulfofundulus luciae]|uniref:Tetratricopeptide (TPR) repeat protein/uncharacterized protein YegL n=1 Tax=Desulfofundulus luciae TaxID=74702 RepID=A0ABU0B4T5_9FIRM|nr:tetratricopeptide repeat protein [Desulfofundulus luciae]MDQ0287734.1 tetratricopeptide (TPR) repeat protein/uncharacterized protein YegL [Desulfofundulus luciae]